GRVLQFQVYRRIDAQRPQVTAAFALVILAFDLSRQVVNEIRRVRRVHRSRLALTTPSFEAFAASAWSRVILSVSTMSSRTLLRRSRARSSCVNGEREFGLWIIPASSADSGRVS